MPTIGIQLDPFECLTHSARSCNKSIHERIHLTANAFIDNLCIVTRHSCVGVSHHLTNNLQRYIVGECYGGCEGVSRCVESK